MKKVIATLIFSMALIWAFAQQIEISEAPRAKENGTYNSYLFELPDVTKSGAEDDWKAFLKDFKAKVKKDKKANLWFADDVKMPRLSNTTVDVYARIIEDSNPNKRTSVIVWFDLGDSYVNSETDKMKGNYAREILAEFAMLTSKHHAESIVKKEEDRLKELKKDLKKLEKSNKEYRETIDKAKNTISKNEKSVEINELDQRNKVKAIKEQKAAIELANKAVKKFSN